VADLALRGGEAGTPERPRGDDGGGDGEAEEEEADEDWK